MGSHGFLGKHCVKACQKDFDVIELGPAIDLEYEPAVKQAFGHYSPDLVLNCSGYNGGISFNVKYPFDIFRKNTLIAANVLESCIKYNVKKVVSIIASCAYDSTETTLWPEQLLQGQPHSSVAGHGYAKRNYAILSDLAHKQYGLNAICVTLPTLYGPGDSFDPDKTKVMGALIKKFVDAKDNNEQEVVLWGDGQPRRQFLYVEDAAKLLNIALLNRDYAPAPYHAGCTKDIAILDLARMIQKIVDYRGVVKFDSTKPNGQYRKEIVCDSMNGISIAPLTSVEEGIQQTVNWYRKLKELKNE